MVVRASLRGTWHTWISLQIDLDVYLSDFGGNPSVFSCRGMNLAIALVALDLIRPLGRRRESPGSGMTIADTFSVGLERQK